MTELWLVTSVVRQAGRDDASGLVRVFDRDAGKVVARALMRESEFRDKESNPRGGVRGARGASVWNDRLVIANSERLIVLDSSWNVVRELTHPLFGGIHDILADDAGIWVTSTAADLVVRVDWSGRLIDKWDWRADRRLLRELGHLWLPRPLGEVDHRDPELTRELVTNAAHINGIAPSAGGVLVSLGRVLPPATFARRRVRGIKNQLRRRIGAAPKSEPHAAEPKKTKVVGAPIPNCRAAIVRLARDGAVDLLYQQRSTTVPNHNVCELDDWLVFNDTNHNRTTAVSRATQQVVGSVAIPGDPAFARGLAHVSERRFLVGSQEPAALYELDLGQQRLIRTHDIGGMPNECVYGIVRLPAAFGVPANLQL
ncbi:MAG: hypothetical protein H0V17_15700 [Deltaproteobacteria bacterium]|nr:hypothetical protein [Deltaproteobacteria bacterium]